MTTYNLPGFGELNLDQLDSYYDTQIDFGEHTVLLDLSFDEYSIPPKKLDAVKSIINNLTSYNSKALTAINEDYTSGDTVKLYMNEHSDLLDNDESALARLYLKRVGFYPENESQFAVFDYTINENMTQYLLVVNFKENGDIDSLTMES